MATRRMVVGFLFSPDFKYVALIKKNKPEWQFGRFNGIGGKLEAGETGLQAMRREFHEEAGLQIADWTSFCHVTGPHGDLFDIECFWATGPVEDVQTMEAEPVGHFLVAAVLQGLLNTIGNIPWLLAMAQAMAKQQDGCTHYAIEERG